MLSWDSRLQLSVAGMMAWLLAWFLALLPATASACLWHGAGPHPGMRGFGFDPRFQESQPLEDISGASSLVFFDLINGEEQRYTLMTDQITLPIKFRIACTVERSYGDYELSCQTPSGMERAILSCDDNPVWQKSDRNGIALIRVELIC